MVPLYLKNFFTFHFNFIINEISGHFCVRTRIDVCKRKKEVKTAHISHVFDEMMMTRCV